MAKTSRSTAPTVIDHGPVVVRSADADGYNIGFIRFNVESDGAPLLKGLPEDRCACPHWGYVFEGTATFTFPDRVETYEAGDAFYTPPGHTPAHSADSEILLFSPSEELAVTDAAMQRNMAAFLATQGS
ncbi:MAG: cupin domain-containing protein [Mycobacteriales bacterium]